MFQAFGPALDARQSGGQCNKTAMNHPESAPGDDDNRLTFDLGQYVTVIGPSHGIDMQFITSMCKLTVIGCDNSKESSTT